MVAADDPVEVARRRDVVAKRARDENLRDEADARGWSSAIPERSLALRRRRGSASPPFARATTSSVESFSPELASSAAATFFTISSEKLRPQEGSCGALLFASALRHPVYSNPVIVHLFEDAKRFKIDRDFRNCFSCKSLDTTEELVQEVWLHL